MRADYSILAYFLKLYILSENEGFSGKVRCTQRGFPLHTLWSSKYILNGTFQGSERIPYYAF